ncbi:flagellar biosynthesis regulator FlaF [Chachezhania antarctica]|uniref:flagellar biosynthesis regulator FlaF n=1 Tax=Chachezhania antarctica TaxID=2340860 RepID=UPI000EAE3B08
MNAQNLAQNGYSKAATQTRTPRGIEYEALARITHRLRQAEARGPEGFSELAAALHDNRRLWDIFAVDVAESSNPLPPDLRARIFYLAEFTQAHSSKVLAREASIIPLLDINTAIMRGLRGDLTPPDPALTVAPEQARPQQTAGPKSARRRPQAPSGQSRRRMAQGQPRPGARPPTGART